MSQQKTLFGHPVTGLLCLLVTYVVWGSTYLMLFGSVFAFTCFMYAVKVLPTTLVATYTYVNPVIAVFLGWLLIDEPITGYTVAGTVLIIAGVYGVFREKRA